VELIMSETIPVTLPDEVLAEVEAFSSADGITRDELLRHAVRG
jgi:metal-responsive CopG/Arc/MetJ family transcriptional regulator